MPRPRRSDRERVSLPCSEYLWLRLLDQITDEQERELHDREDQQSWTEWEERFGDAPFEYFLHGFQGLSAEIFDEAVEVYVAEHPGRRPSWWWQRCAPEERRRVSGRLVPQWSPSADQSPSPWSFTYRGERGFWFAHVDPSDPPKLEAQAEFLRRHQLFAAGEERRLTAPDFEPELEFDAGHWEVCAPPE